MAGETDLARAGKPVLVGDLATADELGVQQLEQGAQLPVLLRRNSTADTDERLRPRHGVDHVVRASGRAGGPGSWVLSRRHAPMASQPWRDTAAGRQAGG